MRTLLFACAALICPLPAIGQTLTGNDLYEACNSAEPVMIGLCSGHIIGLVHGMPFGGAIILSQSGSSSADETNMLYETFSGYCMLSEVENIQIIDIVKDYIEKNPSIRHSPARQMVLQAMQSAFPSGEQCR